MTRPEFLAVMLETLMLFEKHWWLYIDMTTLNDWVLHANNYILNG